MNKIALIIKREYWTRVRKPSFLIMTILGPLLLIGGIVAVVYATLHETGDHKVLVVDPGGLVPGKLKSTEHLAYAYSPVDIDNTLLTGGPYTLKALLSDDPMRNRRIAAPRVLPQGPGRLEAHGGEPEPGQHATYPTLAAADVERPAKAPSTQPRQHRGFEHVAATEVAVLAHIVDPRRGRLVPAVAGPSPDEGGAGLMIVAHREPTPARTRAARPGSSHIPRTVQGHPARGQSPAA